MQEFEDLRPILKTNIATESTMGKIMVAFHLALVRATRAVLSLSERVYPHGGAS